MRLKIRENFTTASLNSTITGSYKNNVTLEFIHLEQLILGGIDKNRQQTVMHAAPRENKGLRARRTVRAYADK